MKVTAKKRFGQNFLKNASVIERITHSIQPKTEDCMVEIGPGLGAMTRSLLPHLNALNVVEIDHTLIPLLEENCQHDPKLTVFNEDALAFDFSSLLQPENKLRVVGNLPYNISTPLLFHLMEYVNEIKDCHFMLQKEVVDRIVAAPGTKVYGRLSVMMQYFCEVEKLFIVSPSAFTPRPKVDSAILRLTPKADRGLSTDAEERFSEIVRLAFASRRKTLRNNLKDFLKDNAVSDICWKQANIDPGQRAETLTVDDFICFTNTSINKE